MASVQRFVSKAKLFPLHIIRQRNSLQHVEKERHFAVLKIQRVWQGYVVRKQIAHWHWAATVLQKYIRGFLLRLHLHEMLMKYLDDYRMNLYHRKAAKIQAWWRGYWERKNRVPIKDLLAARLKVENANEEMQGTLGEAFDAMDRLRKEQLEAEAHQWVLFILFKLHHLLRTETQEGVYSLHGKTELSEIEQLLKSMKFTEYMLELKRKYYNELEDVKPEHPCIFQNEQGRRVEAMYKNRDRSYDTRPTPASLTDIYKKPFNLTKKLPEVFHPRSLNIADSYIPPTLNIERTIDKTKHITDKEFDLHVLKKVACELKPPPYYLDFWSKLCDIHNLPNY